MLSKYRLWLQIGGLVALVLLGFWVGWSWQGANGEAALARSSAAHANTLGEIARAGQRQLQKQQELLVAERERLQALDQEHYGELEDAKADNERLRRMYAGADAERRELRIQVRVARADAVVSETTGGSSVGDVAALELSPEAGRAFWSIRAGMIEDQAKLRYFQQLERDRQGAD
ncbi:lysis system i-spanin subunit Rz [Pseudomonas abyssi]|uniref:lysis system i-spanin subunit Rz n=1 Tax=Pseudomonas abyssi TaxID=170540 RepID=UPI003C7BDDAF